MKLQLVYTTASKIGNQLLLASTISNVLLGPGSVKAFNECLPLCRLSPNLEFGKYIAQHGKAPWPLLPDIFRAMVNLLASQDGNVM